MVLLSMIRKCVYTGKKSSCTDNPMPKETLLEEKHNWANKVPCSEEYKNFKKDRLPTDLEMEAFKLFNLLEVAKIEVQYLEARLSAVQDKINKQVSVPKKKTKKDKEIDQSYIEKEVVETSEDVTEEVLSNRKKSLWDE